jgi:hypothetical protein
LQGWTGALGERVVSSEESLVLQTAEPWMHNDDTSIHHDDVTPNHYHNSKPAP